MKQKRVIKNLLAALTSAILAVLVCLSVFAFAGCDFGNKNDTPSGSTVNGGGQTSDDDGNSGDGGKDTPTEVKAESITLSETAVTLDSKGTQALTCTVVPQDAKVKTEISDKTVVKYENGTLTALTAGTATVKVYSEVDNSVYAECAVTVNAPEGYKVYTSADCKFVYPSSWSKTSVSGTIVAYASASGTSNVNLTAETKNNTYFTASSDKFKNVIISTYKSIGYTATFTNCTVDKTNYAGYERVHVVYDYSVSSGASNLGTFHQEQMILNSGTKTYVLTVTYSANSYDKNQPDTIFSEFVGLK